MDFSLEEEQKLLAETLARFVQKDYGFEARRATLASDAGVSLRAWAALAEMGALGLPVSSEYGGYGGGAVETMVAMQAFGRGLLAEPYFATVVVGAGLVQRAGSDAQRAAILPAVVEGRLRLALAHGEAGARYELAQVVTRAAALGQAGGGGWKLDGAKSVVLHGAQAGTLIVSARTSGQDRDASGISLFLVPRDAPGVLVRDYRTIDGLRAAEVSLTGVAVGADALLGPEGGALPLLEESRDRAIAALAAEAVGTMEALSEQTLDYIRQRQQFGQPIGRFQAMQHKAVDVFIQLEQCRSMAMLAAMRADAAPAERARDMAAVKVFVGRAGRFVAEHAIQMHGGMGVTDELPASHYAKRLAMLDFWLGDAEHHLDRYIAATLVSPAAPAD